MHDATLARRVATPECFAQHATRSPQCRSSEWRMHAMHRGWLQWCQSGGGTSEGRRRRPSGSAVSGLGLPRSRIIAKYSRGTRGVLEGYARGSSGVASKQVISSFPYILVKGKTSDGKNETCTTRWLRCSLVSEAPAGRGGGSSHQVRGCGGGEGARKRRRPAAAGRQGVAWPNSGQKCVSKSSCRRSCRSIRRSLSGCLWRAASCSADVAWGAPSASAELSAVGPSPGADVAG